MHTLAVLEIVKLSLQITLRILEDMPAEKRQAAWDRHEKRMEFWERLFDRFDKKEPA